MELDFENALQFALAHLLPVASEVREDGAKASPAFCVPIWAGKRFLTERYYCAKACSRFDLQIWDVVANAAQAAKAFWRHSRTAFDIETECG